MNQRACLKLSLFVLVFATPRIHAQIINNGDFELPVIPPSSSSLFDIIPGWTPVVGFFEIQSNFFLGGTIGTPSGNQYLELNAMGPSTIRTNPFATIPGQEYVVSYLFAASPVGPATQTIGLTFSGSPEVTDSRVNGSVFSITPSAFSFFAATSSSSLTFRALSPGDSGNWIDAVTVTAVPEPTSLLFVAGSMIAFAYSSRRRRHAPCR